MANRWKRSSRNDSSPLFFLVCDFVFPFLPFFQQKRSFSPPSLVLTSPSSSGCFLYVVLVYESSHFFGRRPFRELVLVLFLVFLPCPPIAKRGLLPLLISHPPLPTQVPFLLSCMAGSLFRLFTKIFIFFHAFPDVALLRSAPSQSRAFLPHLSLPGSGFPKVSCFGLYCDERSFPPSNWFWVNSTLRRWAITLPQ